MTTPTNVPGFGPQQPFANAEDRAGNALQVASLIAIPEEGKTAATAEKEGPVVYKSLGTLAKQALGRGGVIGSVGGLGTGLQQSGQGGFGAGQTAETVASDTLGGLTMGTVADLAGQLFTRPAAIAKIVEGAKTGDASAIAARDALVKHEVSPLANLGMNVTAKAKGDFQDIHGQTLPDFVAQERLPVSTVAGEVKPKLNTKVTTDAINDRVSQLNTKAEKFLESSQQQFSLKDAANEAAANASKFEKNATTLKGILLKIQTYFTDEMAKASAAGKLNGGEYVDATTMNGIKQGADGIGYQSNDPSSQPAAKAMGGAVRTLFIDRFGKTSELADILATESKYLDARTSLEGMHKNDILETPTVKKIKATSMGLGGSAGAGLGATIGQHFGQAGTGGMLGAGIGEEVGRAVGNSITSKMMNDPGALMSQASARLEKLGISSEFDTTMAGKPIPPNSGLLGAGAIPAGAGGADTSQASWLQALQKFAQDFNTANNLALPPGDPNGPAIPLETSYPRQAAPPLGPSPYSVTQEPVDQASLTAAQRKVLQDQANAGRSPYKPIL